MLKWVQSGLSSVAGTAEPEYGREAIYSVNDAIIKEGTPVSRETSAKDFNWNEPTSTSVETQTFYFTDLKAGFLGFAQVIYSSVMGIHTNAQFTFRLFHTTGDHENIWTSTKLSDFRIEASNFYAEGLSIELTENSTYVLKFSANEESNVDLTVVRLVPGVIFGKDGSTIFGDDIKEPWGTVRHLFWPRCSVVGTVVTPKRTFEINGYTMFVMALQGMKPHHVAKTWNFLNFQSEEFSAVQMEFTTPISYANAKVNIGIVTSKDKILLTSINNVVVHSELEIDEVGWPAPKAIAFNFISDKKEEQPLDTDKTFATVSGKLTKLVERVDVMAEVPQFVKTIVSGVAGARPYIYQYANELEIDVEGKKSLGLGFNEATFICEGDI